MASVPRRALVTGIEGFTGHFLKEELEAAGWRVFGLGMQDNSNARDYRKIDLEDVASLDRWVDEVRPHAVAHLAGIAFVGHDDADAFYRVNLRGTRNLLVALAKLPRRPDCVLLASSANVYGNAVGGVLDEATPPSPANDYAVSKLAMEYMARLWLDKLPIVIVRPFNYTGAGQNEIFLIPKVVSHFRRRADRIELGNLDVWRDFSDVRAVVAAYRRLLEIGPAGSILNICSGRTHSLREVIAMAERIAGYRIEVVVNPAFARTNEVRSLCGDPSRLRSIIGHWEALPLEDTVAWMLQA